MIFLEPPGGFSPRFEIVSCFVEFEGNILVLHRQDHKPQGDTWGVPAGKVLNNESYLQAVVRELEEEVGIKAEEKNMEHARTVYVRHHGYEFPYVMFKLQVADSGIKLNEEEHKAHAWVTPEKALELDLIEDEDACIQMVYFD